MASNIITINFVACQPAPVGGYRVSYRPTGSAIPYRVWPDNFLATPAVFTDTNDPEGTSYEGFIQGDCGEGKFGIPATFTAMNPEDPGAGSVSGSDICDPVGIPGGQALADANEGVPYADSIVLLGSAPFTLSAVVKPSWMTISVSGNVVNFTGTPEGADAGTDVAVSFTASNCFDAESADYADTIDVFAINGNFENLNTAPQRFQINSVTGVGGFFYSIMSGSFPILNGQAMTVIHSGFSGNLAVNVTAPSPGGGTPNKKLEYVKNGVVLQSTPLFTPGSTITFPGVSFVASDQIILRIVPV